jgi:hypothetical protein
MSSRPLPATKDYFFSNSMFSCALLYPNKYKIHTSKSSCPVPAIESPCSKSREKNFQSAGVHSDASPASKYLIGRDDVFPAFPLRT